MVIYTVRQGDSVYGIARRYGVSVQDVIGDNGLQNPGRLVVGQTLVLPAESVVHTVQPGETFSQIAALYGVTQQALAQANPSVTDPDRIDAGQQLVIPVTLPRLGSAEVNGYTTGIRPATLEWTLPFLTYLTLFSYEARADGSLASLDDAAPVQAARAQRVAPMMAVTNLRPEGGFSSDIAHAVLTDPAAQDALLENIVGALGGGEKYYGLNIDFEYIRPEDREAYNAFLRRVVERLHPLGYRVATSLAPKTSADQPGLLYEAHDYPVHGELADRVILMTYEWGYTYGPPMAVAPLDRVEQVLQYAVTAIPPEKILMGIPNYGYDWTLPFVQGSSARPLTNAGAVNLAAEVGAEIRFDPQSQSPFFNYYDSGGRRHEVWFEDARSIRAKLELADRYGLAGVSYWTVNSFFPQNRLVVDGTFEVIKRL